MEKGGGELMLFLLASAALPKTFAASEPVTCSAYNITCDIGNGALIGVTEGVGFLEECARICYDDQECNYYTFYDSQSLLFKSACFTYRFCNSVHECEHCVSEERNCANEYCSHVAKNGVIAEDNLVEVITGIGLASECQELCKMSSDCNFFTYFDEDNLEFPGLCTLLTKLLPPFTDCKHCRTGPKSCRDGLHHCYFFHNSTQHKNSLMLSVSSTVEVASILGECHLKILAVGSGGSGYLNGGGGGSGYLEQVVLTIPDKATVEAIIGDGRESYRDTLVQSSEKQLIVLAKGGENGASSRGGDGYSGGGDGYYDGGSNGGNGGGSDGGTGSGLDISQFKFDTFTLTPGAGGHGYLYSGGGGGGVLINQQGPSGNEYYGEGYGGGGGYGSGIGLPGVVIIETIIYEG